MRPESRWVLPLIESYSDGLLSDKPNLTAGEARTLEIASISRAVSLLILAECRTLGLIRKTGKDEWDLQPGAAQLARFLSVELKALQTLGLERRAKPIGRLTELLAAASEPNLHGEGDA